MDKKETHIFFEKIENNIFYFDIMFIWDIRHQINKVFFENTLFVWKNREKLSKNMAKMKSPGEEGVLELY